MKDGLSNNIDRLFRDKMLDFSQNPPEEVWSMIEQDLAKNRKGVIIPFYFKIAAGIVLLLGLGTLTWKYFSTNNDEVRLASTQPAVVHEKNMITA
jgi:hypothetical protein